MEYSVIFTKTRKTQRQPKHVALKKALDGISRFPSLQLTLHYVHGIRKSSLCL